MQKNLLLALAASAVASLATGQRIATESAEPNNTFLTASAYGAGYHARGEVEVAGDADWWAFTLSGESTVTLFTGRGLVNSMSDSIIEVFDSAGTMVARNDDARGLFSVVTTVLPAGDYYASVLAFGSGTGTYTLDMSVNPSVSGPLYLPEGPEDNGDPNNGGIPTIAACEDIFDGNIADGSDTDWYTLTITAPTDININTDEGSVGTALVDSTLRLYDASFTSIAFNDDGGPGLYSQITQTALPVGTYYIEVDGFGTFRTGNYSLEIDCDGMPGRVTVTPTSADWVDNGGGCGSVTLSRRSLEVPLLGTTFCVDVSGMQPGALGITALGYNTTVAPDGTPLPLNLDPFGATGCTLYVEPFETLLFMADANGESTWCVFVPFNTAFIGAQFFQQALAADPAVNAAGFELSNWATVTVGDDF